mmetsp:Transcript_98024/g.227329  ORF Transcript_98024/g.227329 Transcript_98024/m.227329 type:complete len:208 (+) Transcript_98024:321-944(+)
MEDGSVPCGVGGLARTREEQAAADVALPLAGFRRLLALGGRPKRLRGINIQRPWARLILEGTKTVEARKYALKGYCNEDLWVIETKGGSKSTLSLERGSVVGQAVAEQSAAARFVSRIVGVVRFESSFRYEDLAQWRADECRHCIPNGSAFDWQGPSMTGKSEMHGWRVASARALAEPQAGPAEKGMIGCKAITRMVLFAPRVEHPG